MAGEYASTVGSAGLVQKKGVVSSNPYNSAELATSTHRSDTSRPKRGLIAALASAVVPGLGQIYTGRRGMGRPLLIADAVIGGIALFSLLFLKNDVLKIWVSPGALLVLMVVNLVILAYRGLASADAYFSVRKSGAPKWLTALGLATVAVVLVVPHLAFGYLTVVQASPINTVFLASEPVAAATAPDVTTSGDPIDDPSGAPGVIAPTTTPDETTTTPDETTTTTNPTLWDGLERLNIVLLGADAGEGRTGLRTDTTIVVSIDPSTGNTAMFSVPRDLSDAPLPEGMGVWGCDCFPDLFTHLYEAGVRNPKAFPGPDDPSINAIKGALGEIFGIPIHYYALVTLDGFVDVVDALGGVTIDIPKTIFDATYPSEDGGIERIEIKEGTRQLNGHEALAYARIRRNSDDFNRMNRQRWVPEAVLEASSPTEILFRFGAIAEAMKRSLKTDIPQERLADFIDLLPLISTDRIATLRITRTQYQSGGSPGRTYYDIDRIRKDAQSIMADPEKAQEELGLDDLDITCGLTEN
ncbi:MAG: LCP family protein [Acidimicrobiia bacterium]